MLNSKLNLQQIARDIKTWGRAVGFQQVGISDTDLSADETALLKWLAKQRHGSMSYMERHGKRRSRPAELIPGTVRVISVRMDYFPDDGFDAEAVLDDPQRAFISRYALGRDYHKVMRSRLAQLARRIEVAVGEFQYRVFTDSAPVMEKPLARNAGLGWIGKHTNLINDKAGSWFFLGEIYTDLPLPVDPVYKNDHCGSCRACMDVCPTGAIVAPYELDARRCISYLTIELRGSIPEQYRKLIGNRVYGCDDCQLFCPWNKFAQATDEPDYQPRHGLNNIALLECFAWSEPEFLQKTEGSAIRRIGYECWLRNVAVALGNTDGGQEVIHALRARLDHPSELVREHVQWALREHGEE
ncbi:MAG: tRNA epoxyqueuosine(34) reductase QueG [Gammaproteobacteria bacterium]